MELNKLLNRQIEKHLVGEAWQTNESFVNFIKAIHNTYQDQDETQQLSEHAFNLVDQEYTNLTQKLSESEARMKTILYGALDAVISMDQKGLIIDWNPEAERIFGYSSDEAKGTLLSDLIIPDTLKEAHRKGLENYLMSGHGPLIGKRIEITAKRQTGEMFPVELTISVLYNKGVRFFNAFLRDITQRKNAEQELKNYSERLQEMVIEQTKGLKASEARLRTITENAPGNILELDRNGYICFINRPIFPHDKTENALGKVFYEWAKPEYHSLLKESLEKVFEHGINTRCEIKSLTPDQIERTFIVNISPVKIEGEIKRAILIPYDISERYEMEAELIKAKDHAEAANAAKSEFLANVSHELRTPLNGVIGFTDLLDKTPLNQNQHKYLSIVSQSANSLLSLIDDILDFSKIDAGKFQLNLSETNLATLCEQVSDMVKYQIHQKGLTLELNISSEIPPLVVADEIRIKQVLANLLTNASKFTEQGKVELKIELLHQAEFEVAIRFSVRDTGIGIDPRNQKKIFDAFVQEDISTTKKYGGTGLGLTISNKILALMNSELHLESEQGKGSLFYFDLHLSNQR